MIAPLVALALAGPGQFVALDDVDPTIRQDMRYATTYNFVGRRIAGYREPVCILTRRTARALRTWADAEGIDLKVGISIGGSVAGLPLTEQFRRRWAELFPRAQIDASGADVVAAHHALAFLTLRRFATAQPVMPVPSGIGSERISSTQSPTSPESASARTGVSSGSGTALPGTAP